MVGLRPDKNEAWYLSALSKYHLEDYKGAENDCSRAISIDPFIIDYVELRAMSRLREEKYDSAIVDFTHALEMNPDNCDYWFNRAYCYSQEHAFAIALQQLDYIEKRWPSFNCRKGPAPDDSCHTAAERFSLRLFSCCCRFGSCARNLMASEEYSPVFATAITLFVL